MVDVLRKTPRTWRGEQLKGCAGAATGRACAYRVVLGRGRRVDGAVLCAGGRSGPAVDRLYRARRLHPLGDRARTAAADAAGERGRDRAGQPVEPTAPGHCGVPELCDTVPGPVPRVAHPDRDGA